MIQSINYVILQGSVGRIELRQFGDVKGGNFSMVTESFYQQKEGSFVVECCWHNVIAFESDKIQCLDRIQRGTRVLVKGMLQNMTHTDSDGKTITAYRIKAQEISIVDNEETVQPASQNGSAEEALTVYEKAKRQVREQVSKDIAKKVKATRSNILAFTEVSLLTPDGDSVALPQLNGENYRIISAYIDGKDKLRFDACNGKNDVCSLHADTLSTETLISVYNLLEKAVADKDNIAMEGDKLILTEAGRKKYQVKP